MLCLENISILCLEDISILSLEDISILCLEGSGLLCMEDSGILCMEDISILCMEDINVLCLEDSSSLFYPCVRRLEELGVKVQGLWSKLSTKEDTFDSLVQEQVKWLQKLVLESSFHSAGPWPGLSHSIEVCVSVCMGGHHGRRSASVWTLSKLPWKDTKSIRTYTVVQAPHCFNIICLVWPVTFRIAQHLVIGFNIGPPFLWKSSPQMQGTRLSHEQKCQTSREEPTIPPLTDPS